MSLSYRVTQNFKNVTVDTLSAGSNVGQVTTLGRNTTVGSSSSGDFNVLNHSSGSLVRLPAPSTGLVLQFIVGNTTGGHVITAPSAVLFGAISATANTSGGLAVAGATSISTGSGTLVGDRVNLVCDGTRYYVSGVSRASAGFLSV